MPINYQAPVLGSSAFNCPNCDAFADQTWFPIRAETKQSSRGEIPQIQVAFCARCRKFSLWNGDRMLIPSGGSAPFPNSDLPDDVKVDYEEARGIAEQSPRGAAALLRLGIQKVCAHLGESGKDINKDIAMLVSNGLPVTIQQALDIVRVVGNNAVHPGQIDLRDDPETANHLFQLVNLIADVMITQPKHIQAMYNDLPESARQQIEERDSK